MKLNPPNAHRSQIKICEKRQTRNVQFRFMQNAFRILKPIQKSSKCVWVFRNTGANAFAKNQTCLAYEDKRDLYCKLPKLHIQRRKLYLTSWPKTKLGQVRILLKITFLVHRKSYMIIITPNSHEQFTSWNRYENYWPQFTSKNYQITI